MAEGATSEKTAPADATAATAPAPATTAPVPHAKTLREISQDISVEIAGIQSAGKLKKYDAGSRFEFSSPEECPLRLEADLASAWGDPWLYAHDKKVSGGLVYYRAGQSIVYPADGDLRATIVCFLAGQKRSAMVILHRDTADQRFSKKTRGHKTDMHYIEELLSKFFDNAQHVNDEPRILDEKVCQLLDGWKVHARDVHAEVLPSEPPAPAPAARARGKRQHSPRHSPTLASPEPPASRRHVDDEPVSARDIKATLDLLRELRNEVATLKKVHNADLRVLTTDVKALGGLVARESLCEVVEAAILRAGRSGAFAPAMGTPQQSVAAPTYALTAPPPQMQFQPPAAAMYMLVPPPPPTAQPQPPMGAYPSAAPPGWSFRQ